MGHNLAQLGTASLDGFGGLVTFVNPTDLPENASPMTWDTDFLVGSVETRAGLSSVYVFTDVYQINDIFIDYNVGTFTYSNSTGKNPTINEGFVLSGFTGNLTYLNGLTVFVDFVNTSNHTFMAVIQSGQNTGGTIATPGAEASSTTGQFIGPNIGGAVAQTGTGSVWSNPNGILGNSTFANAVTAGEVNNQITPAVAANFSSPPGPLFTNPANLISTVSFASIALSNTTSSPILAYQLNANLPSGAVVNGITVSFQGINTGTVPSVIVQLMQTGITPTYIGTASSVPVAVGTNTYTLGSANFQWGTNLTAALVNSNTFGVAVKASTTGLNTNLQLNSLKITISYSQGAESKTLEVTNFAYSLTSGTGITGFGTTFQAYSSAATTIQVQLMKGSTSGPVAVGDPKTVSLTTTPTIYTVGASNDLWGTTWNFTEVNNVEFGVSITASGTGTTFINDLDTLVYISPALSNFLYIKTFEQVNQDITTLALDSTGIMWKEDVTNLPGVLSTALSGILPGSYAKSATAGNREFICFSDLNVGTERPRTFDGTSFYPLSQVGPGAPPAFQPATSGSGTGTLAITAYTVAADASYVTFTYTGTEPSAGQIYSITNNTGSSLPFPSYLAIVGPVLGVPAPTGSTFAMALSPIVKSRDNATGSINATATLQNSFAIQSIVQNPQQLIGNSGSGHGTGAGVFWGAGPGPNHQPGSNLTVYYSQTQDSVLVNTFNANTAAGIPTYVYISNLTQLSQFDGTYAITAVGNAFPSGTAGAPRFYFVVNVGQTGAAYPDGTWGNYQLTIATVTTQAAVPGLTAGNTINITGESPSNWNNNWSIVTAVNSSIMNITQTQLNASGVATYNYSLPVGSAAPQAGQLVSITGCTNSSSAFTVSPFNTTGVIASVNTGNGTFTISGFLVGSQYVIPARAENPPGQAQTFGTQFTIDPGALTVGTATSPIYGNGGATGALYVVGGGSFTPITQGTRQGVVFFITESGYWTTPSPPVIFTIPTNTLAITVSNLPIGPPNVIARGIAITEAGQNGIPGANFYVIENPVKVQVLNNAPVTYSSTIVNDNVTTSVNISFTDQILLNSTEVDVQGNDLFNLIELGSSAWCVPYANRMFYGLQLNKVQNFNNLTFDGGYLPSNTGNIIPLGWQVPAGTSDITLNISPVTGDSLYINNTTGGVLANAGLIFQTAYQDQFQVPIININTTYSVRVAARAPSGNIGGTLTLQLIDYFTAGSGGTSGTFGIQPYGTFQVSLSSMSTNIQVFTGPLLTTPFPRTGANYQGVSPNLVLSVQVVNLAPGADCEIDRIEVFPTQEPYLLAQVYGSYINDYESIDASGNGGIIDTTSENAQPCMGGFVMHDNLYLMKTNSMYSTEDNPTSEPSGWGLREVSNKAGAVGINAYDYGEEWAVMANRAGIYGFNGGQPVKLMHELWNLWETINWDAGRTIVLRNDVVNRRMFCAIPLPVPNQWLPYEESNPNPTSPNVILMCNYQGLNSFEEFVNSPEVHTTMFGTLAAVDMKRKWSIWRIPTPYMDFITRQNNIDMPLFICNGIESSKIYQLLDDQLSDDGVAIWSLYTTYGFVNAAKSATLPIFGFHVKRYTSLQVTAFGAGSLNVTVIPNTLTTNTKLYYTVPQGLPLAETVLDDYWRPLNIRGNRAFLQFSTDEVGSFFNLSKILLSGKADPHAPINPTGGGNVGTSTVQTR